jgi:hypothetical protein
LNIPARESVTCISRVLKTRGMKAPAGIKLSQKTASLPPKDELWVWTEI